MKNLKEMSINERIIYFRKFLRFTQTDMAEELGIKCSTYSQLERKGKITCERLIEISKILNVDIFVLLYGEVRNGEAENFSKKELERYKERYSFLENITMTELKFIKNITYLSRKNRYFLYEQALKMHKK